MQLSRMLADRDHESHETTKMPATKAPNRGDEDRWRAVETRDPAADGAFVYAVRTTGIYCRPTCPSRRPKRANASFYETYSEAEGAGYVPCKRCRPSEVSRHQRLVAQVQQILTDADPAPSLAELGRLVGLSPSHLQRLFKRATGMSPKQYAMACREERLKQGLREGKKVTTAMYDAGYGSSQALYSNATRKLGMRPASYKRHGKGENITFGVFEAAEGGMLIAATAKGLVAVRFGEPGVLRAELRREFSAATVEEDLEALTRYRKALDSYLGGTARRLDLPIDVRPTDFQHRVWEALRRIPYGETRSYGEIAESIGKPGAARAVARACATNPLALVIPCHRVVRASGEASGYRWGAGRKQALLARESD